MGSRNRYFEAAFSGGVIATMRRVVITGLGAVSGNGSTADEIWQSLRAGEAARCPITSDRYFEFEEFAGACTTSEGPINTVCGSPLTIPDMAETLGIKGLARIKRYDRH